MSRLSKNIIYNLFGQGLLIVLGFVAVKYIFKRLGEDALGIIYFTITMNAILCGVLEKGVFATTVREVSAHIKKEPEYIHDLVKTGSFFCWIVYLLFSIAVYFSAPIIVNKWIKLTTLDSTTAIYVLRILGVASLVAFPLSFYASLLRGLQRMEFNNIIDVTASAFQQFGIVIILLTGSDIFHVAHWIAICYGLRVLGYLGVCKRFFPVQSFFPRYIHSVIKRNLEFTSKMVSISVLAMVHRQSDKVMISKLLPIGLLGYYGFVYGAISKASLITSAVAQAAFPLLCSLFEKEDKGRLLEQYIKLQDFVCFITIPVFAIVAYSSLPLLTFVFNIEIARTLHLPVVLLSLGFYLNGTLAIPYRLLLATGKPEIAVKQNLYAIFAVLPGTFILIYLLGLSGAALGWVFYFLFCYAYAVPRICSECIKKPAWFFYRHVLKVFLLTTLTYGVPYCILVGSSRLTIIPLFVTYVGASLFFFIGAYFLIGNELRKTTFEHLRTLPDNLKFRTIFRENLKNSKYE